MRDYVFLYINGKPQQIAGSQAFMTLSSYLRYQAQMTGTKVVCEEGDCGACTVLIGRVEDGQITYKPVNSCIQYLYQLDCTHVVSVEGLKADDELNLVQESMVKNHGAQCGYCTPGIVVAMCAMFESNGECNGKDLCEAGASGTASGRDKEAGSGKKICEQDIRDALTGNLCRCTGYEPIIRAGLDVDATKGLKLHQLYPPKAMLEKIAAHEKTAIAIDADGRKYFNPQTLTQAAEFKGKNPGCVIVQGGTDICVQGNKRGFEPAAVLSLSHLPGLQELKVEDNVLIVGGKVTLSAIEQFVHDVCPELQRMLWLFGSPQIKNTGTLSGNIVNASPIADTIPFLYVTGAEMDLVGVSGVRKMKVGSFYKGYKTLDLAADEIVSQIRIPLPAKGEILKLYKVSKRKNLDISTFTAAFKMQLAGDKIASVTIAYGGVAPVVLYLPKTQAFLTGKPFVEASFAEAGAIAVDEIAPISDVRGDAEYRFGLAESILLKLFHEVESTREPVCR